MTATVSRQGRIILRATAGEKLAVKPGDVLVVARDRAGRIFLQKGSAPRRRAPQGKSYLTPSPLASATLERIYARPNPDWDKVEAEAVARSRRALVGQRLEEL